MDKNIEGLKKVDGMRKIIEAEMRKLSNLYESPKKQKVFNQFYWQLRLKSLGKNPGQLKTKKDVLEKSKKSVEDFSRNAEGTS